MSLHVRLYTNFWTHRKTAKLRSFLGNDAFWIPPRLWSYAAENQPDGDFSAYSPEELALLLGYMGDAQAMLQAMQQASFLVGMKINDWETHNGYHHEFSERAKKAANARWKEEKIRKERKGKETSNASSNACSINEPKTEPKKPQNEDAVKVLEKLNARIGSKFRPVHGSLKLIAERLKEGFSVEDCFGVIEMKAKSWMGEAKTREWLNPHTLFRKEKFPEYVGQIGLTNTGNGELIGKF